MIAGTRYVYEVAPVAIRFGAVKVRSDSAGWLLFTCPICGETRGHLYVNPADQRFHCFKCAAGGLGGVDFYQLATGLSWEQSLREVRNPFGSNSSRPVKRQDAPPACEPAAPLERRDQVYRAFLQRLPLHEEHLANLRRRGLPGSMIRGRYASVPGDCVERWNICRQLQREYDLENVPGFYVRESRQGDLFWDFAFFGAGFFIPVMSASGQVQGLKIRLDAGDGPRYLVFSSLSKPSGASPGAPVHVAVPVGGAVDTRRVWVTEGELKADVAAHLLSRVVLSVPGVSAWRRARAVLEEIGAREVVIAFDADLVSKQDVADAKDALVADLVTDFRVLDSRWDGQIGKGIDDALVFTRKDHEIKELEFIAGEAAVRVTQSVETTTKVSVTGAAPGRPGLAESFIRLLLG
jgi:hypothetical protein